MSCSEAERQHKDGIPWPMFPDCTSVASRCVPNLKPAPKVQVPGLASRSLLQKDQWVQCPGWWPAKKCLSDCYSPVGPRNTNAPNDQSKAIKEYLLGGSHKN